MFPRPSQQEVQECAKRTLEAFDRILRKPDQQSKQILVKNKRQFEVIVEQPDPLKPAQFKKKKAVKAEKEASAPVLSAPVQQLSDEQRQAWKIPKSLSNYKTPAGFVAPLKERSAMRQPQQVNDKFRLLNESLSKAQSQIKERIEGQVKEQVVEKEPEFDQRLFNQREEPAAPPKIKPIQFQPEDKQ